MCPDPQLLSIYIDGELPSPWKEKMEAHLSDCSLCREKLNNLLHIQELFKKETHQRRVYVEKAEAGTPEKFNLSEHELMEKTKEKIWRKLEAGHSFRGALVNNRYNMWKHRVSIPIPAAAAAAVVIALLTAFLVNSGSFINNNGFAAHQNVEPAIAEDMPQIIPTGDLNSVLEYLGVDRSEVIILQLPESGNFSRSGEPAIIRAADYTRR